MKGGDKMKISEIREVVIDWYGQLIARTTGTSDYTLNESSGDTFRGCWNYGVEQINLDGQLVNDSYVIQDIETGEKIIFHEDDFEILSKVQFPKSLDRYFESDTLDSLYIELFEGVPSFPEWDIYEKYFIKQEDGTFRVKDES